MRAHLRNAPVDAAVSAVLALTIFAFAAGSSSVQSVHDRADGGRWVLLGVLAAAAVAYAAWRRPVLRLVPATTLAAAVLVVLALGSVLWSVTPHLTFDRGVSLAVAVLAGALLAYGTGAERGRVELLLYGILAGAVAVALASLLVFAADPGAAVKGKTSEFLSRFRGFEENPTTAAILYALALPVAALLVSRPGPPRVRAAAAGAFVLVDGLLVASGSRGPQAAALAGLAVLLLGLSWRGRLWLVAAIAATVVAAVVINVAQTKEPSRAAPRPPASPAHAGRDWPNPGALAQELGPRGSGVIRTLFGSSGRTDAWRAALDKGDKRPALGYGFGTEDKVFEDRYYRYQGTLVSSSWIGLYLQLGAFGVAAFVALWLTLAVSVVALVRRHRRDLAVLACAAVTVAAFPISFVESWIYSVGNLGTVPFWIAALLLGTAAWRRA